MILPLPEGYTARGARYPEDVDDVVDLYAACDLVDVGAVDPAKEMIDENWRAPRFDPGLDVVLVDASDGSLAATGECGGYPGAEVDAFIRVHPSHRGRGLGDALIEWAEARGRAHVTAGSTPAIRESIASVDEAGRSLLEGRGYAHVRTYWHMQRPLDEVDPHPAPPQGIDIRPVEVPVELPQLHAMMMQAFDREFGYVQTPFDEWHEEWFGSASVDPGLFLVAWDGTQMVGAAMSMHAGEVGWIGDVAVRAPWRGRGIGRALLSASFAMLAERGYTRAQLNVDAGNETGATRLYERVGMTVRRQWLVFEKPLTTG